MRIVEDQRLWNEGMGDISVDMSLRSFRISGVLFVPQPNANLLSISALNQKGLRILFSQRGVETMRRDTSVTTGTLRGRKYYSSRIIDYLSR